VQPELFEDLSVEEPALEVELLVRAGDGDLGSHHPGAGDAEDSLQVLLGPEGAELAAARADDGDNFPVVFQTCLTVGNQQVAMRLVCQPKATGMLCHQ